jgi:hypothetical protein
MCFKGAPLRYWLRKTQNNILAWTEPGLNDTPSVDEQKKVQIHPRYSDAAWTSESALFLRDPALAISFLQTILHGRVIYTRVTSSLLLSWPLSVLFKPLLTY